MFHRKIMIIDDLWVSVGSANFDNRSFRLKDEANLNVFDRDFALVENAIFDRDLSLAREVTWEEWKRRPIMEKIGDATVVGQVSGWNHAKTGDLTVEQDGAETGADLGEPHASRRGSMRGRPVSSS